MGSATERLAALGVGPEQLRKAADSLDLGKLAGVLGGLLGSMSGLASNFVFLLALLLFLGVESGGAATGSHRSAQTGRGSPKRWRTSRGEPASTCW